jgi:hypothetical protein
MKIFKSTLLAFGLCCATLPLLADETLSIPPLQIKTPAAGLVPAGNWTAGADALDYAATQKLAQEAEAAGKTAEALTAWERVIDRTICTDAERSEARAHISKLRPKVAVNTDASKAKKWTVLALIYKEIDLEVPGLLGSPKKYHQVLTEKNLEVIGKELAGWRDLVFEYSSGLLLLDINAVVVTEPLKKLSSHGGKFHLDVQDATPAVKKAFGAKKYDTVISYIKYRGQSGANVPKPGWVAATVSRVGGVFGNAGYIMIPWGEDYPFVNRGELWGEMELHEWLHQMDTVVDETLAYPKGVAQNPDSGGRDKEYIRPRDVRT